MPSKVANYRLGWAVFSTANQPQTSPNLKFCFIKMSHRATLIYNDFDSNSRVTQVLRIDRQASGCCQLCMHVQTDVRT